MSTINTKLLRWHGLPILLLAALILVTLTPEPALAADEKYTGGSGDGFSVLTSSDIHLYGNPAPTVTSVSPTKGTTADSDLVLTINGTNFVSGGGLAAEINYNGANAIAGSSVTWVSSNQITAHFNLSGVTTNLGSAWDVKVTNPDSQTGTGADLFTIYRPNPTVGSITPNSGVNTGAVNITNLAGTNFVTGQTSVKLQKAGQSDISGTAVTVVSPTQITCTFDLTGAATGTWNVVVTVTGAESAATLTNGFTVTAPGPTVTSVSPTKGTTADSDLVLTINGTNFVSGGGLAAEINYNGANAIAGSSVTWVSSNQITAHFNLSGVTTNLGSAWDVKVTNPDSQTGTGNDLFTIYRPNPTVGSITPNSGVNTGAVNITNLAGTNFVTGQTSVKLQKAGQSDISGTAVTVVSPTQITCTFDLTGAATGTWNVVVTVNGAESAATLTNGFTVTAPGPTVTIPTPIPTKPRASTIPPQFKPAQMSVRYLSVSPQQTYAGQPVTITTNVVNTGDEAGNYNVALKINGQVEQTKMVSVGPQGTQPVKFTVTKAEPGTYTVNISDQRGSFTVTNVAGKPSTGIAAGLLLAVAMAVIVMLVGLLIIIARKRFQSY